MPNSRRQYFQDYRKREGVKEKLCEAVMRHYWRNKETILAKQRKKRRLRGLKRERRKKVIKKKDEEFEFDSWEVERF